MNIQLPDSVPDMERLTGLVFELASQLHAERARRLALEEELAAAGVLAADWESGFAPTERYRVRCQEALDDSMQRLLQIMAESADPRVPLRGEAAAFSED